MIHSQLRAIATKLNLPGVSFTSLPPSSPNTRRDETLCRRLCRTIEHDLELADIQGIHFYVQNGVVTLYGAVRHNLDRDLLTSLVRHVPGVKGVVPHLQVMGGRFGPAADSGGETAQ